MIKDISSQDINSFTRIVWNFYNKHGRHDLAWRKETDSYSIVLSEIMLQQTQVNRVEGYYKNWKQIFPDWQTLSEAKLSNVLKQWQGLGYNRRGKYLHDIAKIVVNEYKGVFPTEGSALRALPGIGPYTAAAVEAFSFNKPSILIETNIRTVIIHHFFPNQDSISEKEILDVLELCLKKGTKAYENPREWNWALMDYGAHLKKEVGNLNKKSKTYTKQSKFEGSSRQLRSQILRIILEEPNITTKRIKSTIVHTRKTEIDSLLLVLEKQEMVAQNEKGWSIL